MIDRGELTTLIEKEDGVNWWKPDLFERNILPYLSSELEIIERPPQEEVNYNCFVFALGLQNYPEFLGGKNPIQKEFIHYVLSKDALTPTDTSEPGSLVFYKDSIGVITHGGIMEDNSVVLSKWMWGPTIRHDLWNVPSSFGDVTFFTNKPESAVMQKLYKIYKDSGVYIAPIL